MKKLSIVILTLGIFALCSCHTSSTSPSIVGRWSFTNITGSIMSTNVIIDSTTSITTSTTVAYSFAPATNTLTATTTKISNGVPTITTQTTQINSEIWTFNSDGTDSLSEIATYTGSSFPDTVNNYGNWVYLSNTHGNSVFETDYMQSTILSGLASEGNNGIEYSISGHTLTLTNVNGSSERGDTASENINLTLTFTLL